jgi:hypothetical protein
MDLLSGFTGCPSAGSRADHGGLRGSFAQIGDVVIVRRDDGGSGAPEPVPAHVPRKRRRQASPRSQCSGLRDHMFG